MPPTPNALILTGASGFMGRHLLDELKGEWRVFAIARRSQHDCGAPQHPEIAWLRVDLADRDGLARVFREIATAGGAPVVVHLAAYYDFTGEPHPEYQRTNIDGTRNLIEAARGIGVEQLVFASSVAACHYPRPEGPVSEATPPDGRHVYAWSKRTGERLVREAGLRSAVVRFGALYSDWCEYPPLYVFLETWLSRSWRARLLAGLGTTALPYVHVRDVAAFFRALLERRDALEADEVLVASTAGATSHLELYAAATRAFFGEARRPRLLPRGVCRLGTHLLDAAGAVIGQRPFERPWMVDYVDRQLEVDNQRTCRRLGWAPSPRYAIERRLPFVIERKKSEPWEYLARNAAALRREPLRADLRIHRALGEIEDEVVAAVTARIGASAAEEYPRLRRQRPSEMEWSLRLLCRLLLTSVQSGNRMLILNYLAVTCHSRFEAGVAPEELRRLLDELNADLVARLEPREELRGLRQEIHERVSMPLEFGKDEVLEQHERWRHTPAEAAASDRPADAGRASDRELLEDTIWRCLAARH